MSFGAAPLAVIVDYYTSGVAPKDIFEAPAKGIKMLLDRNSLGVDDIDLYELNEAFAAQVLANIRELELAEERLNVCGGGIALGHPIGASGARILVTLLAALETHGLAKGVAALCIGGGEATAMAVERIAGEIANDHRVNNPLLVGILKGSYVFLADLSRGLGIPHEIDFIRARSYGKGMRSSGAIEITKDIEHNVTGRTVIIVEDILDTGLTLRFVSDRIRAGNPGTIETCALLVREGATPSDYMGLWIPQGFVVGYGIDYAEEHRELATPAAQSSRRGAATCVPTRARACFAFSMRARQGSARSVSFGSGPLP